MKPGLLEIGIALSLTACAALGQENKLNTTKIDELTGLKGKLNDQEHVYKVSSPRVDMKITVDKWEMPPFMGLTSWASFMSGMQNKTMVMGDFVLLQDEVNPVMSAALDHGLQVTALHNHFFFDEPKVYFMHIGGSGDPEKLAKGVKEVWDAIKKVRSASPTPATRFAGDVPKSGPIDAAALDKILGVKNESQPGVVKYTIKREGKMHGVKVGGSMGLTTWAAFQGSDAHAVVAGDFIMSASEVQSVLRTLRSGNLQIVALHNHMIGEEPAFYFVHYWGKGPTRELARTLSNALAVQKQVGERKAH